MIKVIRWDKLDILETELKTVNEFYTKTNVGPILTALLFPISQLDKLKELKVRIDNKKRELSDIEGEIYKISRDFK